MENNIKKDNDDSVYKNFEAFCMELEQYQTNLKKINDFISQIRNQVDKLSENIQEKSPENILREYGYQANEFHKSLNDVNKAVTNITKKKGYIENSIQSFRDMTNLGNQFSEQLNSLNRTIDEINISSNNLTSTNNYFYQLINDKKIKNIQVVDNFIDKISSSDNPLEKFFSLIHDDEFSKKVDLFVKINNLLSNNSIFYQLLNEEKIKNIQIANAFIDKINSSDKSLEKFSSLIHDDELSKKMELFFKISNKNQQRSKFHKDIIDAVRNELNILGDRISHDIVKKIKDDIEHMMDKHYQQIINSNSNLTKILDLLQDSQKNIATIQDLMEATIRIEAEKGNPEAQYALCLSYYNNNNSKEDYVIAAKWCKKAADQGHVKAQYKLGLFYFYGHGVKADKYMAEKWFRKAADQGDARAKIKLEK